MLRCLIITWAALGFACSAEPAPAPPPARPQAGEGGASSEAGASTQPPAGTPESAERTPRPAAPAVWRESQEWRALKAEIRAKFPAVPVVSVEDLWSAWKAGERPILLDARAPAEYAVSHLPGAQLAPDLAAAQHALEGRPSDTPVVVYCSVGYRSARLAQELRAAGWQEVRNLEGSIFEWRNRGLPVERDGKPVEGVHPYDSGWGRLLERRYWDFGTDRDG